MVYLCAFSHRQVAASTSTHTLTQADNNKRVREERYPPCRSRMCPDMEGLHTVMWPCSGSYVITSAATCSPWPKYDNWDHLPAENRKSVSSQRLDSAIMQLRSVRGHLKGGWRGNSSSSTSCVKTPKQLSQHFLRPCLLKTKLFCKNSHKNQMK